jgi:hypothetical protein
MNNNDPTPVVENNNNEYNNSNENNSNDTTTNMINKVQEFFNELPNNKENLNTFFLNIDCKSK